MARRPKSLKVVERTLMHKGRRYYGLADLEDGHAVISIDPVINASEKERLNTLVHEGIHIGDWMADRKKDLTEREVNILAENIVDVLWQQGYRRVLIK